MNWHLISILAFLLAVFGGLAAGSAYHYFKYEKE